MPRIEEPDRADWGAVLNRLVPLARGNDLIGAGHLLDRLENLAGQYAPSAAEVDLTILRRNVGALLEPCVRRDEQGWSLLRHLETQALSAVRDKLGLGDGERTLSLLIHEGELSIVEIANQLGHSTETLLRVYAHVIAEMEGKPKVPAEQAITAARFTVNRSMLLAA